MENAFESNFLIITVIFSGVRIFRSFTVHVRIQPQFDENQVKDEFSCVTVIFISESEKHK